MDTPALRSQQQNHRIFIPNYTLGEEITNAVTHGIGAGLGIAALVLCVVKAVISGAGGIAVTAAAIYGSSLILLYTVSTIYHALRVNKAKRVFRVLDHCTIYLLIAGTYTPYTLISLRGPLGWTLFGIIWGTAILSIVLNSIDLKKFRVFSFIAYLVMGWAIVFASQPLAAAIGGSGVGFLLGGGVIYTVGCIFYAVGKHHRYMHSIFHVFVLGGSILHFFSILLYVL